MTNRRFAWVSKAAWLDRQGLEMALAAIVLLSLYTYAWGTGPATTPDSWHYLEAARSWEAAGKLVSPTGTPYVFWGPLYPVLLAWFGAAQYPAQAVAWLHTLGLLGSWLSWTWLGAQVLGSETTWKRLYPWVLALSTPWLVTAKFVWSETVFLLLFSIYIIALYQYLISSRLKWLFTATGVGMLLPLQRTAGLFLLAGVAIGLVAGYGRLLWAYGWWLPLHLALSVAGGVVWQLHVQRTGLDDPLIVYSKAAWGIQPLSDFSFVLLRWVLPLPFPVGAVSWLYLVGGALLVVVLTAGATELGRFSRMLSVVIAVYIGWHVLSHILSRGAAGPHDSERYAAVLFGPVALLLFGALRRGLAKRPRVVYGIVALVLIYSAVRVWHNAVFCHQLQTPVLTVQHVIH
ncbi:hypothetical protein MTX78_06985 [Hymenobacter tibetensis]|uniref:Glycosyltransferase RgtA/B/C/D-like domain-containing protein n=1 Tax=Hymenobacter tibetensis TaxID=497967 RepID=A0ABY4D205_9BACT|nr:hypothetical protein [Hymenobacter tibetensis]UOG76336.1 hypothetical protein MTX78_06985 [Hymenobacter tibetensis]